MLFNSPPEAIMAYELGKIAMHSRIFVRLTDRTQVVPDDKSGADADQRCRLEAA